MNNIILEISDLNFSYHQQQILENINLTLFDGDFAALIGPNGGGKTSLLKILLGLLKADTGTIKLFKGKSNQCHKKHCDNKKCLHQLSYVPQYANFSRNFPISVMDTVLQGRMKKTHFFGFYSTKDRQRAEQALRETYTWDIRNKAIGELSGGQVQRVLVARAIVGEPRLLLLDEPTANIDERSEKDIFDLFKQLNQRMSIIVISHDIGFVSEYVNRVFCLNKTLVCHQSEIVQSEAIHKLYGEHVNSVHHHSQHCQHSS